MFHLRYETTHSLSVFYITFSVTPGVRHGMRLILVKTFVTYFVLLCAWLCVDSLMLIAKIIYQ